MSIVDDFQEELASKSQEPKSRDLGDSQAPSLDSVEFNVDFFAITSRIWYSSRWFLLFFGLLIVAFRVTNSMDPNLGRLDHGGQTLSHSFKNLFGLLIGVLLKHKHTLLYGGPWFFFHLFDCMVRND